MWNCSSSEGVRNDGCSSSGTSLHHNKTEEVLQRRKVIMGRHVECVLCKKIITVGSYFLKHLARLHDDFLEFRSAQESITKKEALNATYHNHITDGDEIPGDLLLSFSALKAEPSSSNSKAVTCVSRTETKVFLNSGMKAKQKASGDGDSSHELPVQPVAEEEVNSYNNIEGNTDGTELLKPKNIGGFNSQLVMDCCFCGIRFTTTSRFYSHAMKFHKDFMDFQRAQEDTHLTPLHELCLMSKQPVACLLCERTFFKAVMLYDHLVTEHKNFLNFRSVKEVMSKKQSVYLTFYSHFKGVTKTTVELLKAFSAAEYEQQSSLNRTSPTTTSSRAETELTEAEKETLGEATSSDELPFQPGTEMMDSCSSSIQNNGNGDTSPPVPSTKTELSRTKKREDNNSEQAMDCCFCGVSFPTTSIFYSHVVKVHKDFLNFKDTMVDTPMPPLHEMCVTTNQPIMCFLCGKAFCKAVTLYDHLAEEHNDFLKYRSDKEGIPTKYSVYATFCSHFQEITKSTVDLLKSFSAAEVLPSYNNTTTSSRAWTADVTQNWYKPRATPKLVTSKGTRDSPKNKLAVRGAADNKGNNDGGAATSSDPSLLSATKSLKKSTVPEECVACSQLDKICPRTTRAIIRVKRERCSKVIKKHCRCRQTSRRKSAKRCCCIKKLKKWLNSVTAPEGIVPLKLQDIIEDTLAEEFFFKIAQNQTICFCCSCAMYSPPTPTGGDDFATTGVVCEDSYILIRKMTSHLHSKQHREALHIQASGHQSDMTEESSISQLTKRSYTTTKDSSTSQFTKRSYTTTKYIVATGRPENLCGTMTEDSKVASYRGSLSLATQFMASTGLPSNFIHKLAQGLEQIIKNKSPASQKFIHPRSGNCLSRNEIKCYQIACYNACVEQMKTENAKPFPVTGQTHRYMISVSNEATQKHRNRDTIVMTKIDRMGKPKEYVLSCASNRDGTRKSTYQNIAELSQFLSVKAIAVVNLDAAAMYKDYSGESLQDMMMRDPAFSNKLQYLFDVCHKTELLIFQNVPLWVEDSLEVARNLVNSVCQNPVIYKAVGVHANWTNVSFYQLPVTSKTNYVGNVHCQLVSLFRNVGLLIDTLPKIVNSDNYDGITKRIATKLLTQLNDRLFIARLLLINKLFFDVAVLEKVSQSETFGPFDLVKVIGHLKSRLMFRLSEGHDDIKQFLMNGNWYYGYKLKNKDRIGVAKYCIGSKHEVRNTFSQSDTDDVIQAYRNWILQIRESFGYHLGVPKIVSLATLVFSVSNNLNFEKRLSIFRLLFTLINTDFYPCNRDLCHIRCVCVEMELLAFWAHVKNRLPKTGNEGLHNFVTVPRDGDDSEKTSAQNKQNPQLGDAVTVNYVNFYAFYLAEENMNEVRRLGIPNVVRALEVVQLLKASQSATERVINYVDSLESDKFVYDSTYDMVNILTFLSKNSSVVGTITASRTMSDVDAKKQADDKIHRQGKQQKKGKNVISADKLSKRQKSGKMSTAEPPVQPHMSGTMLCEAKDVKQVAETETCTVTEEFDRIAFADHRTVLDVCADETNPAMNIGGKREADVELHQQLKRCKTTNSEKQEVKRSDGKEREVKVTDQSSYTRHESICNFRDENSLCEPLILEKLLHEKRKMKEEPEYFATVKDEIYELELFGTHEEIKNESEESTLTAASEDYQSRIEELGEDDLFEEESLALGAVMDDSEKSDIHEEYRIDMEELQKMELVEEGIVEICEVNDEHIVENEKRKDEIPLSREMKDPEDSERDEEEYESEYFEEESEDEKVEEGDDDDDDDNEVEVDQDYEEVEMEENKTESQEVAEESTEIQEKEGGKLMKMDEDINVDMEKPNELKYFEAGVKEIVTVKKKKNGGGPQGAVKEKVQEKEVEDGARGNSELDPRIVHEWETGKENEAEGKGNGGRKEEGSEDVEGEAVAKSLQKDCTELCLSCEKYPEPCPSCVCCMCYGEMDFVNWVQCDNKKNCQGYIKRLEELGVEGGNWFHVRCVRKGKSGSRFSKKISFICPYCVNYNHPYTQKQLLKRWLKKENKAFEESPSYAYHSGEKCCERWEGVEEDEEKKRSKIIREIKGEVNICLSCGTYPMPCPSCITCVCYGETDCDLWIQCDNKKNCRRYTTRLMSFGVEGGDWHHVWCVQWGKTIRGVRFFCKLCLQCKYKKDRVKMLKVVNTSENESEEAEESQNKTDYGVFSKYKNRREMLEDEPEKRDRGKEVRNGEGDGKKGSKKGNNVKGEENEEEKGSERDKEVKSEAEKEIGSKSSKAVKEDTVVEKADGGEGGKTVDNSWKVEKKEVIETVQETESVEICSSCKKYAEPCPSCVFCKCRNKKDYVLWIQCYNKKNCQGYINRLKELGVEGGDWFHQRCLWKTKYGKLDPFFCNPCIVRRANQKREQKLMKTPWKASEGNEGSLSKLGHEDEISERDKEVESGEAVSEEDRSRATQEVGASVTMCLSCGKHPNPCPSCVLCECHGEKDCDFWIQCHNKKNCQGYIDRLKYLGVEGGDWFHRSCVREIASLSDDSFFCRPCSNYKQSQVTQCITVTTSPAKERQDQKESQSETNLSKGMQEKEGVLIIRI